MGTPDFAVPTLREVAKRGYQIVCVYSQPPRTAGRGHKIRKTPVHMAAERLGLTVETPSTLKGEDAVARLAELAPDAAAVVAYGQILPQAVLDVPVHGCFNLHASLLPRWRGAAPIQRAIMAGDTESGVCVMRMAAGLDEGPVCARKTVPVDDATTAGDLHDHLAATGGRLMGEALSRLEAGSLSCTAQDDDGVTYARKIDKAEAKIDFSRPAHQVLRHVHGLSPFPGAWFVATAAGGQALRIKALRCEVVDTSGPAGTVMDGRLTIACSEQAVRPVLLQREGKAPMPLEDFLRGNAIAAGTCIGAG